MFYEFSRHLAQLLAHTYFQTRIVGKEHFPQQGAVILVANHASYLDPFLLSITTRRKIHFLTYAGYYYDPKCYWFCKRTCCIPLKKAGNDISAFKKVLRVLHAGEVVGMFPEGARSFTGKLEPAEPGVALIAIKSNVPILPMGIQGAYELFPRGAKFPKPGRITLTFGTPFSLSMYMDIQQKTTAEFQQKVINLIMSRIAELSGQYELFAGAIPQKLVEN